MDEAVPGHNYEGSPKDEVIMTNEGIRNRLSIVSCLLILVHEEADAAAA